jgi:hypothetical protein
MMQVLHRVLGRPARVSGSGGRVIPGGGDAADAADAAGYLSWHRDIANGVAYGSWSD